MKTGLVLEGGAMRGMYTAGVLDIFLDNDIRMDLVAGVSAGALFGVNYLSGQRGRVIRYNQRFNRDKNYMGLRPLLREGNLFNTQYAYEEVPHRLDPFDDEAFRRSGVPFFAVVTNVETGEPEYIRVESVFDQMDILRASGSMPLVSRPVEINGKRYLDGGIADSIPFAWLSAQGCDKLLVILTRAADYRKKPMPAAFAKLCGRQHPMVAKKLLERHALYNRSLDLLKQWEHEGKAFVIRPSRPIKIGRLEKDPEKLQKVYELGLADGAASLEALREYWMR